ncbi:MAG TPA: hypothetical protein VI277_00240, partial [Candidatus Limnocylindria bacterium]
MIAAVLLLAAGAMLLVWRGAPPSSRAADEMVDSWLAAMAEPSGDRGWSFLSTEAQAMLYGDDAKAYWADL